MALTEIPSELSSTPSIVDNGNATAIKIDSSERVLVGKSASDFATAGTEIMDHGEIQVTRAGVPMYLRRNGSDGDILSLYRDGTAVGKLGVASGNNLTIGGSVASHAGLEFGTNRITPQVAGSTVDAVVSLGYSTQRFQDLFLSGGAYLGGTAAANKLEDYEEGTWTAGFEGTGGNVATTPTTVHGYYTKIGRNVNIYFYINSIVLGSITSGTYLIMTGLPFSASAYSDMQWSYHRGGNAITGGYIQSGTTYAYLCDSSGVEIQQANNQTMTAMIGSASYMTNA